ncbi:MAG: cytochrome C, partial [Rhodospirillales bacterium]|nr:cytochrome C [Rhodospirillales bacterium]
MNIRQMDVTMGHSTATPVVFGVIGVAAALVVVLATQPAHGTGSKSDVNPSQSTADHRAFKQLQGPFAIGEITKACLDCHNVASKQIHKTTHWTWEVVNRHTGQKLGKKNVINNFFPSVKSNIESCAVCHIGFDWRDENFDFASEEQVDCLICHDTTGTYAVEKFHQSSARCPVCHDEKPRRKDTEAVDLAAIARHAGPTSRATCGACHFRGGGGDGVKHGDLDSSLLAPPRSLDVHMDAAGLDFSCATCHRGGQHVVKGSLYAPTPNDPSGVASVGNGRATCQSCHGDAPMKDAML